MPPPGSSEDEEKIDRLRQAMYSRTLSEKLKARERRTLQEPRSIVGDDFVHEEEPLSPTIVAPRTIGFARSALWWVLAAAILFFVCAVAFFIYYFTLGGGALAASPSNIDIAVSGPPEVQSGGITELQVVVTNRNAAPLELSSLVVTFPSGTRSAADLSTDEPNLRQDLGTIAPGQSVQGEIPAVFSGIAGQQADVKFELEYHLSGSNSIFVASSDYGITFGSSPLSIAVSGNSETVSGQPVEFTVNVSSNATEPVKGALLSITYPFGFKLTSAAPPSSAPGLWNLGDLNPGQVRSVTVDGVLSGSPGDERTFQIVAGTGQAASSTTVTTPLSSESYAMNISNSFLGLGVSVNGASSTTTVSPGESVSVSISYVNNLPTAIQNAVIVAKLTGAQINGATVISTNGFYRSSDGSMYWDKTTTDGVLSSIPPGGSGTLKFSFTAPTSAMLQNATNPNIVISLSAAGQRTDQSGVPQSLQAAISQTIGITSDLELAAQGLYYASPFGSTGPIPPKAGTETTYALLFTVTNTTNEIDNATLTAHLPPYVRWLGNYSPPSENISVNPNDGTLTWDLGTIKPDVGVDGNQPRQAAIAIGFTPSTSQIGSQPPLLQGITLQGIDQSEAATLAPTDPNASSSAKISVSVKDVTTNLAQVAQSSPGMVVGADPGFSAANATVVAQ
ncbi:MAG TPA: hypothetical protein VMH91_00500 [Candidatus Paceibacterota bacterium]|nr:hypothetical protein [Candidatus Paceibacterota bacterium]